MIKKYFSNLNTYICALEMCDPFVDELYNYFVAPPCWDNIFWAKFWKSNFRKKEKIGE